MVSEPRSAKSQKVVLGCVPRTEEVMALFALLREEFPAAELEGLLAGGNRLKLREAVALVSHVPITYWSS